MAPILAIIYVVILTALANTLVVILWMPWAVFAIIPTVFTSTITVLWLDELRLAANREPKR